MGHLRITWKIISCNLACHFADDWSLVEASITWSLRAPVSFSSVLPESGGSASPQLPFMGLYEANTKHLYIIYTMLGQRRRPSSDPASNRRWINVGLMLGQRRRRWNIVTSFTLVSTMFEMDWRRRQENLWLGTRIEPPSIVWTWGDLVWVCEKQRHVSTGRRCMGALFSSSNTAKTTLHNTEQQSRRLFPQ